MKHFIETADELLELVNEDRAEGDTFPYASEVTLIIDRKGYEFKVKLDEKSGNKFVISKDVKFEDFIKAMAKAVGFVNLKFTREESVTRSRELETKGV